MMTRQALRAYPGHIVWATLALWQSWRPLLAVNRDIFIRSLALQSVFFLITVQGARLGDAHRCRQRPAAQRLAADRPRARRPGPCRGGPVRHAIGARDRDALRRSLVVACGWSLLASLGFAGCSCLPDTCSSRCKPT